MTHSQLPSRHEGIRWYTDSLKFRILGRMSTTIKVSPQTRDQIKSLGASTGQTADQVVSRALVEYERALFWAEYARAAEQDRPRREQDEQELWDRTLRDGLADA